MLATKKIPQYGDDAEEWPRFLYKATRGSAKATYILSDADMAYMVDLTGDPESPSTLHLGDYKKLFCKSFPKLPPLATAQQVIDYGVRNGWFNSGFTASHTALKSDEEYTNAWSRNVELNWVTLVNDAIVNCLDNWNPEKAIEYLDISELNYDSCKVVSGMIFLSLSWPVPCGSEQGKAI